MSHFDHSKESSKQYIERYKRLFAPTTVDEDFEKACIVMAKTKGTRVWDESGKEYIDFNAGVGVAALGHLHPKITEMQAKIKERMGFVETNGVPWRVRGVEVSGKKYDVSPADLVEQVLPLMFPGRMLDDLRFVFGVEGGTAVNGAIKFLLKFGRGKHRFIAFEKAFHGRHGYGLDATNSKPIQKEDYPPGGDFTYVPFPDSPESVKRALKIIDSLPLNNVNGFIFEYLQGEGGFKWPNIKCMDALLFKVRERGIRLAVDEVQTGFGRTGKMFAYQHGNVVPEIVICGKAFGGGDVPMSGFGYDRAAFDFADNRILKKGWHSGTFPGYPLGVASAIMFLEVMQEENLVEHAASMGKHLAAVLHTGLAHFCLRTGYGLMQGLDFRKLDSEPNPEWRNLVLKNIREASPIGIFTFGAGESVVRFEPPLTISKKEIDYLGEVVAKSL